MHALGFSIGGRALRHWIQVGLLVLAAVVCLGTSKQLYGKKLNKPQVQRPTGVTVVGSPTAHIAENVNNQGCFARQRLDFGLAARIRNDQAVALRTHPDWIKLTLGFEKEQRVFRVHRAEFLLLNSKKESVRQKTLAPGTEGTLTVRAPAILPKKRLQAVRWVRLEADLRGGRLMLEFRDIHKLKTVRMR